MRRELCAHPPLFAQQDARFLQITVHGFLAGRRAARYFGNAVAEEIELVNGFREALLAASK
jgi:hypothetical protein